MKNLKYLLFLFIIVSNPSFAQKTNAKETVQSKADKENAEFLKALENFMNSTESDKVTNGIGHLNIDISKGINIDYSGEIKNGKPNGKGLAIFTTYEDQKYFGDFEDGQLNGNGTMFYGEGSIVSGTWKNGLYTGTNIALLDKDGGLTLGDFNDEVFNGKVKFITADGAMYYQNYVNGKLSGRILGIPADNSSITDIYYENGLKNGQGYQYDPVTKKLYQGIWKDEKWVEPSTNNFESFLASPTFDWLEDDKQIFVTEKLNEKQEIEGTCYSYVKATHERCFGVFINGKLQNGLSISRDNSRFIGLFKENKLTGFSLLLKTKFLYFGNFENGLTEGKAVVVDIKNKLIADGLFSLGALNGQSIFLNKENIIYSGNYTKGSLDGDIAVIKPNGNWASVIYNNGKTYNNCKQIGFSNGTVINAQPTDVSVALNDLLKAAVAGFSNIESPETPEKQATDGYIVNPDKGSWFKFPNFDDQHISKPAKDVSVYYAEKFNIKGFEAAQKMFVNLCTQIKAAQIVSINKGTSTGYLGITNVLTEADDFKENIYQVILSDFSTQLIKVIIKKQGRAFYKLTVMLPELNKNF